MLRRVVGFAVGVGALLGVAQAFAADSSSVPACPYGGNPLYTWPSANQAYVYDNTDRRGNCWVLTRDNSGDYNDWTSFDCTRNFPNDKIRSVWTGEAVRLTLMWNYYYKQDNGSVLTIPANSVATTLNSWNGQASAARLVDNTREANCWGYVAPTDVPTYPRLYAPPKTAVWEGLSFGGNDCNMYVMYVPGQGYREYVGAIEMGFRNDTITSVWNFSDYGGADFYKNTGISEYLFGISPHFGYADLRSCLYNASYHNFNDMISSLGAW